MTEKISKTLHFLQETFDSSEYWKSHPEAKAYRYDHSIRVAKYAKTIGQAERMNTEALIVASLLHDISYGLDFNIKNSTCYKEPCPEMEGLDFQELIWHHGYTSALHSMHFVKNLGFTDQQGDEILAAMAGHTQHHMDNMYLDLRTNTAKRLYKQNCDYRFSVLENLQSLINNSKPEDL